MIRLVIGMLLGCFSLSALPSPQSPIPYIDVVHDSGPHAPVVID